MNSFLFDELSYFKNKDFFCLQDVKEISVFKMEDFYGRSLWEKLIFGELLGRGFNK